MTRPSSQITAYHTHISATTDLPTKNALSIHSIYYEDVQECVRTHLRRGGVVNVVAMLVDSETYTWGDEAHILVSDD